MTRSVVIAAGGTGGHIVPGLAVAEELLARDIPVLWIGSRGGMETRLVPAAGVALRLIDVAGLRGRSLASSVSAPWRLARALSQSLSLLRRERPGVVLGMGGFVSGPVGLAALAARLPLVLHEQNAIAGMTNRRLAGFASRVFAALPGAFGPRSGAEVIGNPVRRSFLERFTRIGGETPAAPGPLSPELAGDAVAQAAPGASVAGRMLRILVVGGSRGAHSLNRLVPEAFARVPEPCRVLHQCGDRDTAMVEAAWASAGQGHQVQVRPFIDDMATAYADADLAICRAGAMTVTELAAASLPAILVPFPHAVDDHQTVNARCLSEAGAALLMPESVLDAGVLAARVRALQLEPAALANMAHRAGALFRGDAAATLADALERYVR